MDQPSRTPAPNRCELCGRDKPLTFHHLIPRKNHNKNRFRKRYAKGEMRTRGLYLCRPRHSGIHDLIDEKELGSHALGSGPVIYRGATLSPKVFELLVETAEEAGIEHTVGATGNSTGTDADGVQFARSGIPTGLVSIPLRYMHSPVETVDLDDVEATVELIAAFAERLDSNVDLSR